MPSAVACRRRLASVAHARAAAGTAAGRRDAADADAAAAGAALGSLTQCLRAGAAAEIAAAATAGAAAGSAFARAFAPRSAAAGRAAAVRGCLAATSARRRSRPCRPTLVHSLAATETAEPVRTGRARLRSQLASKRLFRPQLSTSQGPRTSLLAPKSSKHPCNTLSKVTN